MPEAIGTIKLPEWQINGSSYTKKKKKDGKWLLRNGGPYWTIFPLFPVATDRNAQFLPAVARCLTMEKQLIVLGVMKPVT